MIEEICNQKAQQRNPLTLGCKENLGHTQKTHLIHLNCNNVSPPRQLTPALHNCLKDYIYS